MIALLVLDKEQTKWSRRFEKQVKLLKIYEWYNKKTYFWYPGINVPFQSQSSLSNRENSEIEVAIGAFTILR